MSCQGLLERTQFPRIMRSLLKTLENVYGTPVDIEYAVNTDEYGDFVVNLLQCRPLYIGQPGGKVTMPVLPEADTFFKLRDSVMGLATSTDIDVVIEIDAKAYYEFPYSRKPLVANAVGLINRSAEGKRQKSAAPLARPPGHQLSRAGRTRAVRGYQRLRRGLRGERRPRRATCLS